MCVSIKFTEGKNTLSVALVLSSSKAKKLFYLKTKRDEDFCTAFKCFYIGGDR
jgi:hypothetical protein